LIDFQLKDRDLLLGDLGHTTGKISKWRLNIDPAIVGRVFLPHSVLLRMIWFSMKWGHGSWRRHRFFTVALWVVPTSVSWLVQIKHIVLNFLGANVPFRLCLRAPMFAGEPMRTLWSLFYDQSCLFNFSSFLSVDPILSCSILCHPAFCRSCVRQTRREVTSLSMEQLTSRMKVHNSGESCQKAHSGVCVRRIVHTNGWSYRIVR